MITLITIVLWGIAILLFGGGLFLCGMNLFTGNGWEKFWAVVAVILGVVVFTKLYAWLDSLVWCLMLTGIELGVVGMAGSNNGEKTQEKESKPSSGIIGHVVNEIIEEEKRVQEYQKAMQREEERKRWE